MDEKPKVLRKDVKQPVYINGHRPTRHMRKITGEQVSAGGAVINVGKRIEGEALFSRTGNTFYLDERTYHRCRGGHWSGGNFICVEDGNAYCVIEVASNRIKKQKVKEQVKKPRTKPKSVGGVCLDCDLDGLVRLPEGKVVCSVCGSDNVECDSKQ